MYLQRFLSRRCAIATGAIAALSIAACGSPGDSPSGDANTAGGTLTIMTPPEQARGLELFYDDFAEESGVEIDASQMEVNALNKQLRIQITSGTAPDLFRAAPGESVPAAVLSLAAEENAADLSGEPWAENVPESFAPLMQTEEGMYGYPVAGQTLLMFYNKGVFEEVGIEPPTTWTEFIGVCEALKEADEVPLSLGLGEAGYIQFIPYQLAATLVGNLEPNFIEDLAAGETTFSESDGWRQSFEMFFGLIEDGYTNENPLGTSSDQSIQAVATGEAAMLPLTSGIGPVLGDYAENGMDDIGMFVLPATDNPEDTWLPFSPDYLVLNAGAENPQAAKEFLEYLSTPERAAEYAEATAMVPALTNAEEVDNELNSVVRPYLSEDRTTPFANHLWPNGDVQAVLLQTGQEALAGSKWIDDLLSEMDAAHAKG